MFLNPVHVMCFKMAVNPLSVQDHTYVVFWDERTTIMTLHVGHQIG